MVDLAVDFEQWERRRNLSSNTITDRRNRLADLLDHFGGDPLDVATEDVERWLDDRDLVPASRSVYIRAVNAFYSFCVREGFLLTNPIDRCVRPRVPQRLPNPPLHDEVERIVRQSHHDPRLRVMVALATFVGMRRAEVANLQVDEVDMAGGHVLIAGGKGDKDRRLPMHTEVETALRLLPLPAAGFVLTKLRGKGGLTPGTVGTYMSRHMRACGVDKVPHKLRHFFGSEVHEHSGGDLRVTQEALGHASPSTSAIYAAHSTRRLEAAVLQVGAGPCAGCPLDGQPCPVGKV